MSICKRDKQTSEDRRDFLRATVTAGAGMAAVAVAATSMAAAVSEDDQIDEPNAGSNNKGYHVTRHIVDYYNTASF